MTTTRCPVCGGLSGIFSPESDHPDACRCGQGRSDSALCSLDSDPPMQELTPPVDDALPERIGNYQIVRQVGTGGFGTVYEAFDDKLKRRVALKVAHPAMMRDPDLRSRFIREGRGRWCSAQQHRRHLRR